jgi:hypothetical protein
MDLAPDVASVAGVAVLEAVAMNPTLAGVRAVAARSLRRQVTIARTAAATAGSMVVDRLVADGRLIRDGAELRLPGVSAPVAPLADPVLASAMDRLERALAVAAPPGLAEAARVAGCPPAGIRELERSGRIVVLEPDLAYATATYREIEAGALSLAAAGPLTPAVLRDRTGTSRKYVVAILEDLDRRGILRRTDAGHVPGPRAPA